MGGKVEVKRQNDAQVGGTVDLGSKILSRIFHLSYLMCLWCLQIDIPVESSMYRSVVQSQVLKWKYRQTWEPLVNEQLWKSWQWVRSSGGVREERRSLLMKWWGKASI